MSATVQKRYGPVTVERHTALSRQGIYLHVFHEGKDITRDCVFADDTGDGMAEVLLRNENGRAYLTDRGTPDEGIATATVHGITIREGEPF